MPCKFSQFASSRNNAVENGLALSKNAHWLFDQGLWSVSDDYQVVVATGAFAESAPEVTLLLGHRVDSRLRLPKDRSLWPNRYAPRLAPQRKVQELLNLSSTTPAIRGTQQSLQD